MKKMFLLLGMLAFSALGRAFGQEFWERIYTLPDSCNRTYDIATNAQGDIFVATNKGLFKSSDYAETWESVWVWQEGDRYCTALDIAPNGRICVGSNTDHLCFSDDNGDTWGSVNIPHGGGGCTAYRVKYFGNDTLFALPTSLGSGAYVDYSFDGGSTWNFSRIGNWALDYSTDITMTSDRTFYVCLGFMGGKEGEKRSSEGGVYKSHDCMEWEEVELSNSIENCYSVISSHPKSKRIIVGECEPLYKGRLKNETDSIQLMYIYGCLFLDEKTVVTTSFSETGISFDGGESFTYCSDNQGGNRIIVGNDGHLYSTFYANTSRLFRSINPVDDLLKVNEQAAHDEITVSPNPANGLVHIKGVEVAEMQVYNTLGQLVKFAQNSNEINLRDLPQGVYSLRITGDKGEMTSRKIVVE